MAQQLSMLVATTEDRALVPQHPHSCSQPSITLVSEDLNPSSSDIHESKTSIHGKLKISNKIKNIEAQEMVQWLKALGAPERILQASNATYF